MQFDVPLACVLLRLRNPEVQHAESRPHERLEHRLSVAVEEHSIIQEVSALLLQPRNLGLNLSLLLFQFRDRSVVSSRAWNSYLDQPGGTLDFRWPAVVGLHNPDDGRTNAITCRPIRNRNETYASRSNCKLNS